MSPNTCYPCPRPLQAVEGSWLSGVFFVGKDHWITIGVVKGRKDTALGTHPDFGYALFFLYSSLIIILGAHEGRPYGFIMCFFVGKDYWINVGDRIKG